MPLVILSENHLAQQCEFYFTIQIIDERDGIFELCR
jgi:hypothetical protein